MTVPSTPVNAVTTLHGRRLGIAKQGQLVANAIEITQPAVDAVITVGAENTNVRAITVQLYDANGVAIAANTKVEVGVYLDATPTNFVATGGSTGIEIGANGKLLTIVAKKLFHALTDNTGKLTLTWTDVGTEAAYLGVRLPTGKLVMSSAMTNA